MLFSQNMCFFKKPKPVPQPILQIGEPMSQPFDYSHPIPPYHYEYQPLPVNSVPLPPPKTYRTKYALSPAPPSAGPRDWRYEEKQRARAPSQSISPPNTAAASTEQPTRRRKGSIWSPKSSTKKFFRNAGLDENGRLKSEYEQIGDTDWGEPDVYAPTYKKPSAW